MFRTCTLVIIMDSINVMAVITFHSLYYIHFASIFFSIWHTQAQIPGSATARKGLRDLLYSAVHNPLDAI